MDIRPVAREDAHSVEQLLARVAAEGGEALSEFKRSRLLTPVVVREVVAVSAGSVRCYAQAAWHRPVASGSDGYWGIEIATLVGVAASAEVVNWLICSLNPSRRWMFWGRSEADVEVADQLGLAQIRTIHNVAVPLPLEEQLLVPEGVTISGFRTGWDEDAWLWANNAAFSGHPENGAISRHDLSQRIAESWFNPAGLRMAWISDVLVGSCWTKVHPTREGEIYIIGVDPLHQSKGFGRMLLIEGLRYLAEEEQLDSAMLWVDATNTRARVLYEGIGFKPVKTIRAYGPANEQGDSDE